MMGNNFYLLNPSHGKESTLDKAYHKYIEKLRLTLSEDDENRWEIYSIIMEQLISQGKYEYLTEIKYRITDGENPNQVILDIIERESDNVDNVTWFFKRRIEEFLDDDFFKRFYA
jgi:hypothetical protein